MFKKCETCKKRKFFVKKQKFFVPNVGEVTSQKLMCKGCVEKIIKAVPK